MELKLTATGVKANEFECLETSLRYNPRQVGHALPRKSEVTKKDTGRSADLFGEQGYTATTFRQIAKRAKIDAGSIYYYLASKDEILEEVMDIGIRCCL